MLLQQGDVLTYRWEMGFAFAPVSISSRNHTFFHKLFSGASEKKRPPEIAITEGLPERDKSWGTSLETLPVTYCGPTPTAQTVQEAVSGSPGASAQGMRGGN